jgi:hypothetical protein
MKTHSPQENARIEDSAVGGKISRRLMRERAVEVAISHGRLAQDVAKSDWEQAKRDLAIEPERSGPEQESVAESEGWAMVRGSTGHKVPVPSGDDEDDEGRSDVERLVVKGVREAGREQREEADREAKENA